MLDIEIASSRCKVNKEPHLCPRSSPRQSRKSCACQKPEMSLECVFRCTVCDWKRMCAGGAPSTNEMRRSRDAIALRAFGLAAGHASRTCSFWKATARHSTEAVIDALLVCGAGCSFRRSEVPRTTRAPPKFIGELAPRRADDVNGQLGD